ncbi:hypothetical protein L484_015184 [Morus notabilis]|uniref:Uncharacterized protein n=1 Tax=Morus notabilis TaxID=981085 RepID=W9SB47_9ROSA|nr:hypothetical protein L484_015184 [Morus notabilis]
MTSVPPPSQDSGDFSGRFSRRSSSVASVAVGSYAQKSCEDLPSRGGGGSPPHDYDGERSPLRGGHNERDLFFPFLAQSYNAENERSSCFIFGGGAPHNNDDSLLGGGGFLGDREKNERSPGTIGRWSSSQRRWFTTGGKELLSDGDVI